MAIDYSDLFTLRLKSVITAVNTMIGWYSNIDTFESDIQTKMVSADSENLLGFSLNQVATTRSTLLGSINSMASIADQVMMDRTTILNEMPQLSNQTLNGVLDELVADMNNETESVAASAVTIGSVTTTSQNTNVGTLFTSKTLDGVSAPAFYARANREYSGVTSQLSLTSDTIRVTCTADSEADGTSFGYERFQITGKPRASSPFSWLSKGSGGPTQVQTAQASSIVNLGFDSFTSNLPAGWTAVAGTAGTHFLQEATEIVNTGYSLEIAGNCELSIPLTAAKVLTHYVGGFLIKSDGLVSGATLNIFIEGTGYSTETVSGSEIVMNASALNAQTSFGVESFNVVTPNTLPSNLTLRIEVTGMSAGKIYLDFGFFSRPVYHDGIAILPIAGREVYLKGDVFSFDVTNNDAGTYQKFFRDKWGVQLPTSGSPTIAY